MTQLNREYRKATERENNLVVFYSTTPPPAASAWAENGQLLVPPLPSDVNRFAEARAKAKNALARS